MGRQDDRWVVEYPSDDLERFDGFVTLSVCQCNENVQRVNVDK